MVDKFHEECGVVGVYGHDEASTLAYLSLYALQHRGQESAGIVASNGEALISHRGMGHVAEIFDQEIVGRLGGRPAIGHNRYSTSGSTVLKNCQPFVVEWAQGALGIAHNGNLVNAEELRAKLETRGSIFQSTVDSEVIVHLIAASKEETLLGRIVDALGQVRGAYSLVFLTENRVPADIVIAVPDSGVPAAIGYAEEAHLPYEMGLIRNHYVGRTFIEPSSSIRNFGVKVKLNALREVLDGKRVVVVDDSIVRGTTSRKLISMIRQAGAREVHMRISSPPTTNPCFYGIDTPTREELIASAHPVEGIRKYLGADSLAYLSHAGLFAFTGGRAEGFCDACFTGRYPVPLGDETRARQLHLFEARER